MSHYQCKNCGASMGGDYGICQSCTPKEYIDFQSKIHELYCNSNKEWESYDYYILTYYDEYVTAYEAYNKHKPENTQEISIQTKQQLYDKAFSNKNRWFQYKREELDRKYMLSVIDFKRLL